MTNKQIVIENARITFRNFKGEASMYNASGRRNFVVLLDDEDLVNDLVEDGWNVRYLSPRDEDEAPQPYLQVAVNYANIPPEIYMISNGRRTLLDEESIDILDYAEIENVDLTIRPYNWTVTNKTEGTKTGVKAYVKNMYVTLVDDRLAAKYEDLANE